MESLDPLPRRLAPVIRDDLAEKMVFLAGPRQCGKTTLSQMLRAEAEAAGQRTAYFNWDHAEHRKTLRAGRLPADADFVVLDELHKFRTWKAWLKGVYDTEGHHRCMLITGSARLDVYRRGGDSLQGRYYRHRAHPVTLSELRRYAIEDDPDRMLQLDRPAEAACCEALQSLLALGGFPEPLLAGSTRKAARWRLAYGERLVREDLRDLRDFRDLDRLEMLFDRLPDTVGSLLSLNSLREDLEVSFNTVKAWLNGLEHLYGVFLVPPFGPPRIKAVKKASKLYFWDSGRVTARGPQAENLIVLHLLRLCHWITDVRGEKAELRFFRDDQGHEVDAIILRRGKPWLAVEVKAQDGPIDGGLKYLLERVHVPWAVQVSLHGKQDHWVHGVGRGRVRLTHAARLLANLP